MKALEPLLAWASQGSHAYWLVFVGAFLAVALWESFSPLKALSLPAGRRWGNHVLLFSVSAVIQTTLVRLMPVGAANLVQGSPFGLLNRPGMPFALRFVLTLLIFDFLQYWMHRTFHSYFALWRVHEIHHSDPDYDVSTATRFHPLEVLPPQAIRLVAVLLLAPPPMAVLLDQLVGMIFNFTSHANASFPPAVESILRTVFITPDLHRIHHSQEVSEQSSNFGQTFSLWDRAFGTYRASALSPIVLTGVKRRYTADILSIGWLLSGPFQARRKETGLASVAAAKNQ